MTTPTVKPKSITAVDKLPQINSSNVERPKKDMYVGKGKPSGIRKYASMKGLA